MTRRSPSPKKPEAGPPRKIGAPVFECTPDVVEEFCSLMEAGEPLSAICKLPGMPSWGTVCKWKREYPEFLTRYMRAREASAEACEHNGIEATLLAKDRDSAAVAAVQLNAWKWAAAKRNPRTHGERIDANISGILGVAKIPLNLDLLSDEQREVIRDVLLLAPPTIEGSEE